MIARTMMNALKLFFWRYGVRIIPRIPLGILRGLTAMAVRADRFTSRGKRRVLRSELALCGLAAPGQEDRVMDRASRNQILSQIKMAFLSRLGPENIARYISVEGLEHLDQALAKGNGVILLNPHFGPFLLIMPALGHRGYKLTQVALQGEPITGKRVGLAKQVYDAKVQAIEDRMPVTFINAGESTMSVREVFRVLARNEVVLFASTGRGGRAWQETDFLGRKATFNRTPFNVAVKTSAVILPVFVLDDGPLARVVIERPLNLDRNAPAEQLIKEYSAVLERRVQALPDHFAHFLRDMRLQAGWDDHPFFADYPSRSRPAGARRKQP